MKRNNYRTLLLSVLVLSFSLIACTQHQIEVKAVEIKPIHITIDINVKIDKELEDFFSDLDETQENTQKK